MAVGLNLLFSPKAKRWLFDTNMCFPRKKIRILLTWVLLLALLQLLVYVVIFGEVKSTPRRPKGFQALKHNLEKSLEFGSDFEDVRQIKTIGGLVGKPSKEKLKIVFVPESNSKRILNFAKMNPVLAKLQLESIQGTSVPRSNGSNVIKAKEIQKARTVSMKAWTDVTDKFNPEDRRLTGPSDIFLSVKTTKTFHNTRVKEILQTWMSLIKEQVYVFTDGDDPELNQSLGGHLINTKCESSHQRTALCCKMQAELNYFWDKAKERWFCHFDDDNYVNVAALIKLLREYNHTDSIYLGKTSLAHQMQTWDRQNAYKPISFWFATGGAGVCLSRNLVSKMTQYFRNGGFVKACDRIGVPDDCTIGFISEVLLNVRLKRSDLFHSHLEGGLSFMKEYELRDQVTLSHGYMGGHYNRLKIAGPFSEDEDPSRFKSLHCLLNPATSWCPHQ